MTYLETSIRLNRLINSFKTEALIQDKGMEKAYKIMTEAYDKMVKVNK